MGGSALIFLLAGGTAGFAGQVELVSRVAPSQISDTASLAINSGGGRNYPPPSLSDDGRYVAFLLWATNLSPGQNGDTGGTGNAPDNVFLHDRISGTTTLVSHSMASPTTTANRPTESAVLSADGRWVAFISEATDLVEGQPSNAFSSRNLFLYDRVSERTTRVSPSLFLESNNGAGVTQMAVSADGRFIAFISDAPDLVLGQQDHNGQPDIFLYDRTTAKTSLVSHVSASATTTGNNPSRDLSISADGRYVAFGSGATDLVPGQGGSGNVFLYDRLSGAVSLIGPGGYPTISADGGFVVFFSADDHEIPGQVDQNGGGDVFLYARTTRTTLLVSHAAGLPTTTANGSSESPFRSGPFLSADGRFVAFASTATDLVPGQVVKPNPAVFLYDRTSGTVTLASRAGGSPTTPVDIGAGQPSISADGRLVAFTSSARDLVPGQEDTNNLSDVFLFDRTTGATTLVSSANASPFIASNQASYAPILSANGSQIAFYSSSSNLVAGLKDLNEGQDLLLYDTASRTNAYATLHAPGAASLTPAIESSLRGISGDGRYVLFENRASYLVAGQVDANRKVDLFLYDHATQANVLVSRSTAGSAVTGDDQPIEPALSLDGRYVAFASFASDLVTGVDQQPVNPETGVPTNNYDVFLFDRTLESMTLVSRSATSPGFSGNQSSFAPVISADSRYVAFVSFATDLAPGLDDTNRTGDVFLHDRVTGTTILVSRSSASPLKTANGFSSNPVVSADGRSVAFRSEATDLVPGQTGNPGPRNLYLYNRITGTTTLVSHSRGVANEAAGFETGDPPTISADGRYLVFRSFREDLGDEPGIRGSIFLYDRENGSLTPVNPSSEEFGTLSGFQQKISADGRWVVFLSDNENLVPGFHNPLGGNQVYLYDRISKALTLATPSLLSPGETSQETATDPTISADGRYVAFQSTAFAPFLGNLGRGGVYLYDRMTGARTLVSRTVASPVNSAGGFAPLLSADGRSVAFNSFAPDLVAGDFNAQTDVFLFGDPVPPPAPTFPCTVFDGSGLRSNVRKVFPVGGTCGVPITAKKVTVKVTASEGTKQGTVQLYPGNVTRKPGTLRFNRRQTVSATFKLSLATNGTGTLAILPIVANKGTVHVVVEVLEYTP